MINRLGATPVGVWVIKNPISPLQRWIYRSSRGRLLSNMGSGRPTKPTMNAAVAGSFSSSNALGPCAPLQKPHKCEEAMNVRRNHCEHR
jgi:hypothetical protein